MSQAEQEKRLEMIRRLPRSAGELSLKLLTAVLSVTRLHRNVKK